MSNARDDVWQTGPDGKQHIISKCGLYCDTCPAFLNGVCPGCPRLDPGDCIVRDCAHRKKIDSCHDCSLDSCYHFEAYTIRREMMRKRTKRLVGKEKAVYGESTGGSG